MRTITIADLEDIALGAAVLGTGGGGDPYIGKLLAKSAMQGVDGVSLIEVSELADDDLVLPSAMMGAPTVMVEKIPSGKEILSAITSLGEFLGKRIVATIPMEVGGVNSLVPFSVAAKMGIPLVDADGMGRAFPELQMATPTIDGIDAAPMAIADDKGNSAVIRTVSNRWTESLARVLTVEMGASALISLYPMTGAQVKQSTIPGTLSLAHRIGSALRHANQESKNPVEAVCEATGGTVIWCGKVSDVARKTIGGFARGIASIAELSFGGQTLELHFQNEFLIAQTSERVYATTPDLITVLDAETGSPITTEALRYGVRVVVIAMPSDRRWRTPAGLDLVGPQYFGYDIPYVPLEERLQQ